MRQRNSRRSERTRAKLIRAFIELVISRGYDRVNVRDVAVRAGVGRSTLYMHFGGLSRIIEASLEGPCNILAASVRPGASPHALLPLLHHFKSQAQQNAVFFREPLCVLWSRCLARSICVSLRTDPARHRHGPRIPRALLAPALADLQLAIIRRWVDLPSSVSVEAIAVTLTATAQRLVLGA